MTNKNYATGQSIDTAPFYLVRFSTGYHRILIMPLQVRLNVLSAANATGFVLSAPGDTLIIGRAGECDIPIADPSLSSRHFQLMWDGQQCQLVDMGSTNGTQVNDQWVQEATLHNGDEIIAGDSVFQVEIFEPPVTASSPESNYSQSEYSPSEWANQNQVDSRDQQVPGVPPSGPVSMLESVEPTLAEQQFITPDKNPLVEKLMDTVKNDEDTRLYAIIDGSQAIELAYIARMMGHEAYTLFSGDMAAAVAHAGPCLVILDRPLPYLENWVESMGKNAGVLLQSSATLEALCVHLREIFVVKDEEGQDYFFRYYDPRVIRTFLPTCTDQELMEFFGNVTRWICEDETSEAYVSWTRKDSGLVSSAISC